MQNYRIWLGRGDALCRLGEHEKAIADYDKAAELCPTDADIWLNRGAALFALRRYEEAVASYDRAEELSR